VLRALGCPAGAPGAFLNRALDLEVGAAGADEVGCVARLADGTIVALPSAAEAFAEDCRRAALVVSQRTAPPSCAATTIDRTVWQRTGSTILLVTHDVEEAIYLGERVVVMAPRPGRIDSIVDVPFGAKRHQDLKLSLEFSDLKRRILNRIRETSGVKTDLEQLEKLTRTAQD